MEDQRTTPSQAMSEGADRGEQQTTIEDPIRHDGAPRTEEDLYNVGHEIWH